MFFHLAALAHQSNGKSYHFLCAPDSPIDDIKEALKTFSEAVEKVEEEVKAKQAQMEAKSASVAPPAPEGM